MDFVLCILIFMTVRNPLFLHFIRTFNKGQKKRRTPEKSRLLLVLVETKRIELSTLRMRTVRSPS